MGRHAVLRLLLLTLVVFGVISMHTLGHPSSDHGAHAGPAISTEHHAMSAAHAMPAAAEEATLTGVVHGVGMGLDPMNVCLAILTGLWLIAFVAALLFAVRRVSGARPAVRAALVALSRGPPLILRPNLSILRI